MISNRLTLLAALAVPALFCLGAARAGERVDVPADPHAAHKRMVHEPETHIVRTSYEIPDVQLVNQSGNASSLREFIPGDRPVVVNFIFTTCTTICPVITATTLQLQQQLKSEAVTPDYVTISIDPDYDSAEVLHAYAEMYGADWTFLTGAPDDVMAAVKAFDAYRGNKVNHFALTLIRAANNDEWTRVEGLTSAEELARIWRDAVL